MPSTDTYIEKDLAINDEIDKLRHSATCSLHERRDTIVVASVSCIYGLGAPEEYYRLALSVRPGDKMSRDALISRLIVSGSIAAKLAHAAIFPASHYAVERQTLLDAIGNIERDCEEQVKFFTDNHKLIEAQRIGERVRYDIEMMKEIGYCSGIENYSRYFDGRLPGQPPFTLLDYFPRDFIMFIDESHMTIPQLRAMYNGDRARKTSLVDYGFRLPAAFDNRPLKFEEFRERVGQVVYVSATPAQYELGLTGGKFTPQIIRPTGLVDPPVTISPRSSSSLYSTRTRKAFCVRRPRLYRLSDGRRETARAASSCTATSLRIR